MWQCHARARQGRVSQVVVGEGTRRYNVYTWGKNTYRRGGGGWHGGVGEGWGMGRQAWPGQCG